MTAIGVHCSWYGVRSLPKHHAKWIGHLFWCQSRPSAQAQDPLRRWSQPGPIEAKWSILLRRQLGRIGFEQDTDQFSEKRVGNVFKAPLTVRSISSASSSIISALRLPPNKETIVIEDDEGPAVTTAKSFIFLRVLKASLRRCTCLHQQGVRQTVNSRYGPAANGPAERWVGIVKVQATALLAGVRLPPEKWSYACRWVAYVHTTTLVTLWCFINFSISHLQLRPRAPLVFAWGTTTDEPCVWGVVVVSVTDGSLREICSAKV